MIRRRVQPGSNSTARPPIEPTSCPVDLNFWVQIKYLGSVLSGAGAAAGIGYALRTPESGNQGAIVAICLAILIASLVFLLVPARVVAAHAARSHFFGIWVWSLAIFATVLIWLDSGPTSPFIMLYPVTMVLAGVAATRFYVIGTGVLSLGGFAFLHNVAGINWGGPSRFAGAMLLLVLIANAWIAHTQEQRAVRLRALTDDLADEIDKSGWMMDATPEGIFLVDDDGRITMANPAACRIVERPHREMIGALAHDLFHHSYPDGTPFPAEKCKVQRAVVDSYAAIFEPDVYWRPDGSPFDIEGTTVPAPHGGSMIAFHDISERLANQRLKDEFIAVVSHELRTPLTSVRGALGLLAAGAVGDLAPEVVHMVGIAAANTDRLSRLINDILDIDRLESGKVPLNVEPLDLPGVIESAIEEMQVMAAEAGVTLHSDCPPVEAQADADRVQQVVVNLLSNAVKFSDRGQEVVVSASLIQGHVRVDVVDQGRGIPADRRGHLFNRFEQVDASDSREKGGVGLGLAICDGIVRAHGGRIWFESDFGSGTVFSFTLPLAPDGGAGSTGGHRPTAPGDVSVDELIEVAATEPARAAS